MRERDIEARLTAEVRKRGGLCWKFVSPGNDGVPDRIVVTPDGRTIYVELKTRTGRLSALQAHQIRELSRRGADVRVLKGPEEVLDFVRGVMPDEVRAAQLPALRH